MTQNIAQLDGLVPDRLAPKTRKIVLEDYDLPVDIGFHDFEVGTPQRLLVTVEVWVDERAFAAADERASAWDYDFLRTEIGALAAGPPLQPAGDVRARDLRSRRRAPRRHRAARLDPQARHLSRLRRRRRRAGATF